MSFIEISKLSVHYRSCHLIRNLSFKVEQDDVLVIMGTNGSGKSSLLKAMVGEIPLEAQKYEILGINAFEIDSKKKSKLLSYMPQQMDIEKNLIVEDFFHYSRFPRMDFFRALNTSEIEKRDFILENLKIKHLLKRKISNISGGELKKVSIGATFFQESSFTLLDEPFQALDPIVKIEVANFIKIAAKDFATGVVMACHDLFWAKKLAGSMLHLKNGELLEWGSAEQLFTKEKLSKLYGSDFSLYTDEVSGESIFLPRSYS